MMKQWKFFRIVNKIKEYYEKFLLVLLVVVLVTFFMLSFIEELEFPRESINNELFSPYEIEARGEDMVIEFSGIHSLMPGNYVSFLESNGSVDSKQIIRQIIFQRRANTSVALKDGTIFEGRLGNTADIRLGIDWKSERRTFSINHSRGTQSIASEEIEYFSGNHKIVLDKTEKNSDGNYKLSFYQNKEIIPTEASILERPRWQQTPADANASIYDLFTPPIIYLVEGKLSTSLPEEPLPEAKKEPFGMELIKFSNEPYAYKLVSWIGNTPYFEDANTKKSAGSLENIRNRLEVGIPYKKAIDRKPGQPSLVATEMEDKDKLLTIEYFTVEQVKDSRTGGYKNVGRALVKDHKLGVKPFEINSLMEEVFAGNVKIEVRLTLDDLEGKTFSFTTDDAGISFDFSERIYTVIEINEDSKSILVRKKGPLPDQQQDLLLNLP